MLNIKCPHCGNRDEHEFIYGGDIRKVRPDDPASVSLTDWSKYIYTVPNKKGWCSELWWHVRGCRQWITAYRNTATNEMKTIEGTE
jgi:sarcosine oxidase subunit delta